MIGNLLFGTGVLVLSLGNICIAQENKVRLEICEE